VAEAIAECCRWPGNPAQLGQGGGVKPLIGYLRSSHLDLRRAAARALHQVSSDRENCFILHHHGAVMVMSTRILHTDFKKIITIIPFLEPDWMIQLLLKLVGCGDVEIQSAAAGCLSNIRNFIHNA
jgi:HEAT repeat protein